MANIFISYSRDDAEIALRMSHLFEQEGWSTWIDHQIKLGDDFRPEVEREIDAASCVVVLWSTTATQSSWVQREALRAFGQGKLVEVELSPGLSGQVAFPETCELRSAAIVVGPDVHIGSRQEALLARVATIGRLTRPRDSWNATLIVHNWKDQPPSHPIIAWEWITVEGTSRIARRERWVNGRVCEYRTTTGNYWQFGYEGAQAALGYLTIRKPRHEVTLPERNKRLEQQDLRIAFTESGVAAEFVDQFGYPGGGVPLDREQQMGVEEIADACRSHFKGRYEDDDALVFLSADTGDPFEYELSIEVMVRPTVRCKLLARKRTRDRNALDGILEKLHKLDWEPPAQGPVEGGWVRGRRLTEWVKDYGPRSRRNYRVLATLILETFLAVHGAPPAGTSQCSRILRQE